MIKDIYPRPPSSIKDFEGKLRLDEVDVVVMTTCEYSFQDLSVSVEMQATQSFGTIGADYTA